MILPSLIVRYFGLKELDIVPAPSSDWDGINGRH